MSTPPYLLVRSLLFAALLCAGVTARADSTPDAAKPPAGTEANTEVVALLKRGRAQYLAGEPGAAAQTFARVLAVDPQNADARTWLERISAASVDHNPTRTLASAQMLDEVKRAWQRPEPVSRESEPAAGNETHSPLEAKLDAIVFPSVNFSAMELSRVVQALSAMAEQFDQSDTATKGVNFVLLDAANADPPVSLL